MARALRIAQAGVPLHVIQRGNNRGPCFLCAGDHRLYLGYLAEAAVECGCSLHAYVLMTNHVHLLLTPHAEHAVSRMMQQLGRRYVRRFNERHERTGTLWEGRFRSSVIGDERYLLTCHRYIDQNPVRAGLARAPGEYPWSSHRHYAEGEADRLVSEHECYRGLGATPAERRTAYRALCAVVVSSEDISRIRKAVNRSRPLADAQPAPRLELEQRIRRRRTRRAGPTAGDASSESPLFAQLSGAKQKNLL